jgi:hypothetical protein
MDASKIREEAWDLVRGVINAGVADPLSRGNPKWIAATFPDTKLIDFPGYPILIISEPAPEWRSSTMASGKRTNFIEFVISIFSRSNLEMSQLTDAVDAALRGGVDTTFRPNQMYKLNIRDIAQRVLQDGKQKVHSKQLIARWEYFGD